MTPQPRRRAQIHLSIQHLASLIELPDGLEPVSLVLHRDPDAVSLIVEGERLAPVAPGNQCPMLNGAGHAVSATDDNGIRWTRAVWDEAVWASATDS